MSTAYLLKMPDDPLGQATYFFEEAMAHRTLLGAMSPLDRFSVLPYLLDPFLDNGMWFLNHQQAQNDALTTLVPLFGATNLVDTDMDNPEQRTWFEFVNHQELYVATGLLSGPLNPAW